MVYLRLLFFVGVILIGFTVGLAYAYGPNVIVDNGIITWGIPVIIDVEGDDIKNCPDSSTADLGSHIPDAVSIWEGAPETGLTTTIRTIMEGVNPASIDDSNYCDYMWDQGSCPFGGNNSGPSEVGGYNPIVFDEDGEITDLFFGIGQKRTTLGFAGIVLRETDFLLAAKGEGVINLYCMDVCPGAGCPNPSFSTDDVLVFVVHELGHFFGMNHTQVNFDQGDGSFTSTMFAVYDPESLADITTLERDDQVGIAYLYPQSPDILRNDFCTVTGTIRDENDDEFQCANVIARNVDTTADKNLEDAMSFVSGGDLPGGTPEEGRGRFTIMGLAPGETYQITVQPINTTAPLNQVSSGIIPCNGGNGNPMPPTFDVQTLSETVTCQASGPSLVVEDSVQGLTVSQGEILDLDDSLAGGGIILTNTSGNVARELPDSGGGCSLVR